MPKQHIVRQGETLDTIAADHGFLPETLWDDASNASLRKRRGSSNILTPGDELTIPERTDRVIECATGQQHRLKVRGKKLHTIRLVLRDALGNPLSDVEFSLEVPGHDDVEGTTDGDGLLEATVPMKVRTLKLHALGGEFTLRAGGLNAVSSVTGVQQRLNQLGFRAGAIDDDPGEVTRDAIVRFQEWANLEITGQLDAATRMKLEETHEGKAYAADPDIEDEPPSRIDYDDDADWSSIADEPMPARVFDLEEDQ